MGFKEAKRRVLTALRTGAYLHAARGRIDEKNLLLMGEATSVEIAAVVRRCTGRHHAMSPHHTLPSIPVHVLRRDGWYIKFYFLEADTVFISVHR